MKGSKLRLIGPFTQAITFSGLPVKGPLHDAMLEIIPHAGILINGNLIEAVGPFRELKSLAAVVDPVDGDYTVMPGLVDAHTHICWAGSRAADYAMRLSGKSYIEIAQQGGGIWSTVAHTREAGEADLAKRTAGRADRLLKHGVTTIEVKSGYGLNVEAELKILHSIHKAKMITRADLVPTCLAAHIKPKDFSGTPREYLAYIVRELLPLVRDQKLSNRVDIYVDEDAFSREEARYYLNAAREMGFDVTVHADQFSRGGLQLATEVGAISADHLEATTDEDIGRMAETSVIAVALPGASMGLGAAFAPARKLLNAGVAMAIASDWNPGSAPMGNLLMQAAVLGIYERLTMAETLSGITFRGAAALNLHDRGILQPGMLSDFIAFPCMDYREILYNQGGMMPELVWKGGVRSE